MSYLQQKGFNLFTMGEFDDAKANDTSITNKIGSKSAFAISYEETDATAILYFDLERYERETVYSSTLNEVKNDMSNVRNKSIAKYLKNLKAGDRLFLSGFKGVYMVDVKEVVGEQYKASYYLYDQQTRQYQPEKEMEHFNQSHWRLRDLVGVEKNGVVHFLSVNSESNYKLVPQDVFLNYMEQVKSDIGIETLVIYYAYFNASHISDDKLISKNVAANFMKSEEVYYIPTIDIDYWERSYSLKKLSSEKYFTFNFLGNTYKIPQKVIDMKCNEIVDKMAQLSPTDLTTLNDFELMMYYKMQGYIVDANLTTNEWAIRKNHSEKHFFIERAALNNFLKMVQFVEKELNNKVTAATITERNDAMASDYIQPDVALKPFVIPNGTVVKVSKEMQKLLPEKVYSVVSDNGKYVVLRDEEKDSEQKEYQVPRKNITHIVIVPEKYGMAPIPNEKFMYLSVPYAIPVEQECSIEQLCANFNEFIRNLPEDEYCKYLVLDATINEQSIFQLMKQGELKKVTNYFVRSWDHLIMSRLISKRTDACIDKMVYNAQDYNIPTLLGRYPLNSVHGMKEERQIQYDLACQIFLGMYEAASTLPTDKLTIVELMCAYRLADMRLDYHGPTHFELSGECVHTSKYDLLNIEETKQKVFFK